VDEDLRAKITADVDTATPPDLNDFNDLLKSFAELPMDVSTKFKSAFVAFQKQSKKGIDALVKGMQTRKQALDNVIANFEAELQTAQSEIDGKRAQADKLQQEMAKLSEKIVELKNTQSQLLMNASQEEQDLSSQKATFMATADAVLSELNQQEQQLQMYLAPTMPASVKSTRSKR
jgi:chromosome segregation ATPase